MDDNMYCIVVKRECEEDYVTHEHFDIAPTREDVLKRVLDMDLNYDDNYGKIKYWKIQEAQDEHE